MEVTEMVDKEIEEIRRIRHQISEECGHNVRKVADYYRKVERELKESGEFRFEERTITIANSQTESRQIKDAAKPIARDELAQALSEISPSEG